MKLSWDWGIRFSWTALLAQNYEKVKEIEAHYDNNRLEYLFHFTLMSGNSEDSLDTDSCDYAFSMMNIGHAYLCENDTENALVYYRRSRDVLRRHHTKDEDTSNNYFKELMNGDFITLKEYNLPLNDLTTIRSTFQL